MATVRPKLRRLPCGSVAKESTCPAQEDGLNPLAQEDPTRCRLTKPTRHSYEVCALGPSSCDYGAHRTLTHGARVP